MRVLMSTQPAFSHAAQMIPLVRALERRGHAIMVATSAPFVGRLRALGLDTRPFGPDWEERPGDDLYDRTVGRHSFFGFPEVPDRSSVEDLVRLARDTGAQMIVREYSEFTGWAVARRLDLPLVTQAIIHRLPPPAEARVVHLVERLAALAKIEPPRNADELLGSAYLDAVPPSFRCPWEHNVALARPSRPSLYDCREGEPVPQSIDELGRERPLIYVTLGTIFNDRPALWRTVFTALSTLDVDALLTIGPNVDPRVLGDPPANVRIERFVPQSQVLPRCSAVVCHAGFNTLIGAFSHGLPALCIPLDADQPVNARCAADAGAGINAANAPARDARGPLVDPDTIDADDLATALARLLDEPTFAGAAQRLATEIHAMPGPEKIADFLEQLAGNQPPFCPHHDQDAEVQIAAPRRGRGASGSGHQVASDRPTQLEAAETPEGVP